MNIFSRFNNEICKLLKLCSDIWRKANLSKNEISVTPIVELVNNVKKLLREISKSSDIDVKALMSELDNLNDSSVKKVIKQGIVDNKISTCIKVLEVIKGIIENEQNSSDNVEETKYKTIGDDTSTGIAKPVFKNEDISNDNQQSSPVSIQSVGNQIDEETNDDNHQQIVTELQEKIKKIEKERDELIFIAKKHQSIIESKDQIINKVAKDYRSLEELEQKIKQDKKQLESKQNELKELEEKLKDIQEEINNYEYRKEEIVDGINDLKQELPDKSTSDVEIASENSAEIDKLKEKLNIKESELVEKRNELKDLNSELKDVKNKIESLKPLEDNRDKIQKYDEITDADKICSDEINELKKIYDDIKVADLTQKWFNDNANNLDKLVLSSVDLSLKLNERSYDAEKLFIELSQQLTLKTTIIKMLNDKDIFVINPAQGDPFKEDWHELENEKFLVGTNNKDIADRIHSVRRVGFVKAGVVWRPALVRKYLYIG